MPAPQITRFEPLDGDNTAPRTVAVIGTGFVAGVDTNTIHMTRSGQTAFDLTSVTYVSAEKVTGVVPAGKAAGAWDATPSNANGTGTTVAGAFKVMARSIREAIMQDLLVALRAITAASGFHANMAFVERNEEGWLNRRKEYPCAFLAEGKEEVSDGPIGWWTRKLDVTVWVSCQRQGAITEELNRCIADVEQKVMEDMRRGGYAIQTDLVGSQQYVTEVGDPVGLAAVEIRITYRTSRQNPNTYEAGI